MFKPLGTRLFSTLRGLGGGSIVDPKKIVIVAIYLNRILHNSFAEDEDEIHAYHSDSDHASNDGDFPDGAEDVKYYRAKPCQ